MKKRLFIAILILAFLIGAGFLIKHYVKDSSQSSTESVDEKHEMADKEKTELLYKFLSTGKKELSDDETVDVPVVLKDVNPDKKPAGKLYTNEDLKKDTHDGKVFTNKDLEKYRKKRLRKRKEKDQNSIDLKNTKDTLHNFIDKLTEDTEDIVSKAKELMKKPEFLNDPDIKKLMDKDPEELKEALQKNIDERNKALKEIEKQSP